MHDLLNARELKYEIVHIKIEGITDFQLSVSPYNKDKYQSFILIDSFGETVDEDSFNVFEAIMEENPFGLPTAKYYWVECWFKATKITINRKNQFIYKKYQG